MVGRESPSSPSIDMDTARMTLGKRGEDKACEFLAAKGQTILERNHRSGHLEIDIISLDARGLHFVEVKSRVAPASTPPEENVGASKRKKIAAAANRYIAGTKNALVNKDIEVNFDIVAVTFDGEKVDVGYFPNAWYPIFV